MPPFFMKKALVYSVPGTGTRFANQLLEDVFGYEVVHVERLAWLEPQNIFIQMHTRNEQLHDLVASIHDLRVICPLRDPYRSFITRNYRKGYTASAPTRSMPKFVEYWEYMIRESALMNVVFLPVDSDLDRTKLLQSVALHIGAEADKEALSEYLENWPRVGALGTTKVKLEYVEHGTILGETPTFLDFAVDWYKARITELEGICTKH